MQNIDYYGPPGEVARLGADLYRSRLRTLLEPGHNGKYVVIDVDTGEYEIDPEHIAAVDRAAAKHPRARLYATRVGWGVLGRLGGHRIPRK